MAMIKILIVVNGPERASEITNSAWEGRESAVILSDGEVAWERIQADPPDILFMDLMLPGRDGLEIVKEISQDPRLSHIRIILGIVRGNINTLYRDWSWPVDGLLLSPYSSWQIILSIEQLLYREIRPNTAALESWDVGKYFGANAFNSGYTPPTSETTPQNTTPRRRNFWDLLRGR